MEKEKTTDKASPEDDSSKPLLGALPRPAWQDTLVFHDPPNRVS